jgi:hypothetical protein
LQVWILVDFYFYAFHKGIITYNSFPSSNDREKSERMAQIRHQYILVGIETDPTRYHGEHASRPALLSRVAAEQILAHIAADLTSLFPEISRCALTMAGALFDQTQLLQPQLPVYRALELLQQSGNPGSDFQPRLLSIGANNGQMPVPTLQPSASIPLGLLQILPILVTGAVQDVDPLADEMEHRFLEHGQLSAHAAKGIEAHFGVSVTHARLMTMTDLNALLRTQLEHFGFLPLWELLDAAITDTDAVLELSTPPGPRFKWQDGAVHSFFEPFDWWAKHGSGADVPSTDQQLQSAYVDWTREYRRYQTMLSAHGVALRQCLAGLEDTEISDTFLLEESTLVPAPGSASVTEHATDDLGIVAVTVVNENRQMNFFPLLASGLNDVHQFIRDHGFSGDVAYPGRICYEQETRQLVADTLAG